MIVCDGCGQTIRDARGAVVTWDEPGAPVYFAHKGNCDFRSGRHLCSADLNVFLFQLCWNVRYDAAEGKREHDALAELGL